MSPRYIRFFLPVLVLPWTLFCLKYFPSPFLWILPAWILACLLAMLAFKRPVVRATFFNIAVVFTMLWIFEGYAYTVVRQTEQTSLTYSQNYRVNDPVLGRVPVKGIVARSKRMYGNTVVYDVVYSIGQNGLRISPPYNGPRLSGCALFFGCSVTYGEGLNDNQTMPYRVGVHTQGDYRTYNFGFHGYGPNHMLAALESGVVDQKVRCRPTYVIYQVIPDHVARVAGLHSWGRHSPRYRLERDGSVRRYGFFYEEDDPPGPNYTELQWQLSKSYISKWFEMRVRRVKDDGIELFLAIVKASERIVRQKFPGCQFHVILWSWDPPLDTYRKMLNGLQAAGLKVHLVDDILTDYSTSPHQYEISEYDRHPNARANDMDAGYVAKRILGYN